ncbi:hypothetical protein EDB86DRAFT_2955265 [Lactarius hatsudake]|nr:hypothetical protein EDB86DRAFT_2955265 [Lactarius hatsudake]
MWSDAFRWAVMSMTALFCRSGHLYRATIRVVMIVGAVNNNLEERSHDYSSYNDFLDHFAKERRATVLPDAPQASGSDRAASLDAWRTGRKRLIILGLVVYEQHALRTFFFCHVSRLQPSSRPVIRQL